MMGKETRIMNQPQLVIMAAGLGSRFGGLKQMTPVDPQNQWIIDYSIFDAVRAGFGKIILIIKPENEPVFRETLGKRIGGRAQIVYAHQRPDILPEGFSIPENRKKPWGTAHAILCAKNVIDAPFAAINADDFYGKDAFKTIYRFLVSDHPENEYAMVGYQVENTLTENGYVARGVCSLDESGQYLTGITERTRIEPRDGGAAYTEDNGRTFTFLPNGTTVSMNFWGFDPGILLEIESRFTGFLREKLPVDPLGCEYFLPLVPNQLIKEGKASVRVLRCEDKWYGVTYHPDLAQLQSAIAQMKREGVYPDSLWG